MNEKHALRDRASWKGFMVASFAILLVISIVFSIRFGSVKIPFLEIWSTFSGNLESEFQNIIWNIRIPRTIVAILAGANLAVAGVLLQGIMKNPLADPSIIGVSSGAGLAGMIILILYPHLPHLLTPVAFIGATIVAFIVYALAWEKGIAPPTRIILAGVAVSAFLGSGISALMVFYSDRVQGTIDFMVGGLSARSWPEVEVILPYSILGILLAIIGIRRMNLLMLGDRTARSLGARVEWIRFTMTAVATLLAASAVSVVGLLGFVGLIVPHTARLIVGNDYRVLLPASIFLGAAILPASDTIARIMFAPIELPVGVIMGGIRSAILSIFIEEENGMTILRTASISHFFSDKQVLKQMDLELREGQIYSIIGPNGSGKSTLLHILSRQLKPSQGNVYWKEADLYRLSPKKAAQELALLAQVNDSMDLTVEQLIAYGRTPHKSMFKRIDEQDQILIEEAISLTKLDLLRKRNLSQLSGGERQRAWIALNLAQQPKLLFLDEPTTYLDISHQLEVLEVVAQLKRNQKVTIVMVLHDLNHAAAYSDEVIVVKKGGCIYGQGAPEKIMNQKMFKEVFGVEADIYKDGHDETLRIVMKPLKN
ncbi:iron chelate uptake ABC transporter family permease subunit [Gracilibacillus sp. JCM 18860]|uniref:iron chelate uptake ABC transporter family permease subunit n=1 Tax=Gracilibacillus sp. JCM 18860 TaxID=1306159 RepID=UPI000B0BEDFF